MKKHQQFIWPYQYSVSFVMKKICHPIDFGIKKL